MLDIQIRGAEEFGVLSKRLKEAGDKGLTKELRAGLQRAAKPAKDAIRPSLARKMPHRGGLAGEMASTRLSLRATGGRNPRVRIVANAPHDLRKMDQGLLSHPGRRDRNHWYTQEIRSGASSEPIEDRAPLMREEMGQAMRKVAAQIEAGR